MPTRPPSEGLTIGALTKFSHEQEEAFQACNNRLIEVARLYEDK